MGPINPLALEEFNELQTRHQFLEEQLDDVRNTRRDLMRVIKAVDLEIQTVFSAGVRRCQRSLHPTVRDVVPRWCRQSRAHGSQTTC